LKQAPAPDVVDELPAQQPELAGRVEPVEPEGSESFVRRFVFPT